MSEVSTARPESIMHTEAGIFKIRFDGIDKREIFFRSSIMTGSVNAQARAVLLTEPKNRPAILRRYLLLSLDIAPSSGKLRFPKPAIMPSVERNESLSPRLITQYGLTKHSTVSAMPSELSESDCFDISRPRSMTSIIKPERITEYVKPDTAINMTTNAAESSVPALPRR